MTSDCFRDTFIERERGESANDRNDRAIRVAVKWYGDHLEKAQSEGLKVVLITNDQGNKEKAEESGLLVYKCEWKRPIAIETWNGGSWIYLHRHQLFPLKMIDSPWARRGVHQESDSQP